MAEERHDGYVAMPGFLLLNQACHVLNAGFGVCYLVGSAVEGKDWRDIDVRAILPDAEFAELFPHADPLGSVRTDARWSVICAAISVWLQEASGLPVDFQIQSQSHNDQVYGGMATKRIPLGIYPDRTGRLSEEDE